MSHGLSVSLLLHVNLAQSIIKAWLQLHTHVDLVIMIFHLDGSKILILSCVRDCLYLRGSLALGA